MLGPRAGAAGGGTGVSMASPGSLVSYLLLCVRPPRLLGPRGRPGRAAQRAAAPNHARPGLPAVPAWGLGPKLRVRGLQQTIAGLPTGALAEEILTPGEGQIRALFCIGGSPMMAWPDQRRTQEAMEDLDLLVLTDVEYSPTARVADYVVATKMTFETPGMTQLSESIKYFHAGYGFSQPYGQYTPALVDPPAGSDLIEDWQLYYRIAQRMGLPLNWTRVFGVPTGYLEAPIEVVPLDMEHEPTTDELFEIMAAGSHVPLDEVKRHPHGHVFEELLDAGRPGRPGLEARLDVGNLDLLAELADVGAEDHVAARRHRPPTARSCSCPAARTGCSTPPAAASPRSCGAARGTRRSCTRPTWPPWAWRPATPSRSAPSTTPWSGSSTPTPTCARASSR